MGLELSPKLTQNQSFLKLSYISYTRHGKPQWSLAFSGVGLGVGLPLGVRLSYTFRLFPSLFHRISTMETCRKCAVSCNMLQGKCRGNGRKDSKILHQSYILHLILHPILHPELPANTEDLGHWCRKCRRFSKNFGSASIWVIIPVPFHVGIENFCP